MTTTKSAEVSYAIMLYSKLLKLEGRVLKLERQLEKAVMQIPKEEMNTYVSVTDEMINRQSTINEPFEPKADYTN